MPIAYRGRMVQEFDLDAALAAPPRLLLVDEYAHTNAPGSRHPKRWQDIEELLAAGIDVWTTLNIQHLESLNDVVQRITRVRVRETVPDAVFDEANEIVLVDLPPDELLKRLAEGKVYVQDTAARAVDNFFRPNNLVGAARAGAAARRRADRQRPARADAGRRRSRGRGPRANASWSASAPTRSPGRRAACQAPGRRDRTRPGWR